MSNIRKSINTLIAQKVQSCNERLEQCQNLNDRGMCLGDYRLWFDGAMELAQAAGLDAEDTRALFAAQATNDAELQLVEKKAALAEALGSDAATDTASYPPQFPPQA